MLLLVGLALLRERRYALLGQARRARPCRVCVLVRKESIRFGNPVYPFALGHPGVSDETVRYFVETAQSYGHRSVVNFARVPMRFATDGNVTAYLGFVLAPFSLAARGSRKAAALLLAYVVGYTAVWYWLVSGQTRFLIRRPSLRSSWPVSRSAQRAERSGRVVVIAARRAARRRAARRERLQLNLRDATRAWLGTQKAGYVLGLEIDPALSRALLRLPGRCGRSLEAARLSGNVAIWDLSPPPDYPRHNRLEPIQITASTTAGAAEQLRARGIRFALTQGMPVEELSSNPVGPAAPAAGGPVLASGRMHALPAPGLKLSVPPEARTPSASLLRGRAPRRGGAARSLSAVRRPRGIVEPLGAAALTVASCIVAPGGLLSPHWPGDVYYYGTIGKRIVHGQIPYHEFYLEYPPGAIPVFAVPSLISQPHYFLVFKLLMTVCAAVTAAVGILVLQRVGARDAVRRAPVSCSLAPLLLGPLFLNRYDVWPACSSRSRCSRSSPTVRGSHSGCSPSRSSRRSIRSPSCRSPRPCLTDARYARSSRAPSRFVAVGLAFIVPFAAFGFGGLGYSFYIQATRDLQIESLGAQLLVRCPSRALSPDSGDRQAGIARPRGSRCRCRRRPQLAVEVAPCSVSHGSARGRTIRIASCSCSRRRSSHSSSSGRCSRRSTSSGSFRSSSPATSDRHPVSGLLVVALVMTQLSFYDSDHVAQLGTVSWLVLARNLVLVVLFGVLAVRLRQEPA